MLAGSLLLVIFAVRLAVLRAHDFNGSGWWAALLLVPYVGAVMLLALVALPGIRDDNDHGGRPRSGNPLAAMLSVALMTLLLVATYRWVATLVEEVIPTGAAATPVQTETQIAARLLSPDAVSAFRDNYMAAAAPKAFAVSVDGGWGWKAGAPSSEAAAAMALESCDAKRRPYTKACELVNVNGSWVQR
jgi:NADH:ubiquinone oxidoreductase subunit 6 (subunit J)